MHESSHNLMRRITQKQLYHISGLSILDVGSQDINGSYRDLFSDHDYTGLDIVEGDNVDVVGWDNLPPDKQYDVVISGQMLEHCPNPCDICKAMGNRLKEGGMLVLIAPYIGQKEHRRPDYWRFMRNGMEQLAVVAGCSIVEAGVRDRDAWVVGRKK